MQCCHCAVEGKLCIRSLSNPLKRYNNTVLKFVKPYHSRRFLLCLLYITHAAIAPMTAMTLTGINGQKCDAFTGPFTCTTVKKRK